MGFMHPKREIRRVAMQVLFAWDLGGEDPGVARTIATEAAEEEAAREAAIKASSEAWAWREVADRWIERLAPQWPPRRQPGVDRNILRLAVWELTQGQTPPKVVIDEAIELAKEFSTEQSAAFVNGVLDAVLREHLEMLGGAAPAGPVGDA